jgi:hypothetical protein
MEEQGQVNAAAVPADWVSALLQALDGAFDVVQTALEPGVVAAQAYFQQLLQARPVLRDPLAEVNENRRNTDAILIYAGVGIIALLIIAIILKKKT